MFDELDDPNADICRVCRSEASSDRPLYHPCICTGSIKWIHQECLLQWMRYSRKEYCELCRYKFSFTPIYAPNMPSRLPIADIAGGLFSSAMTGLKYWLHYTMVAIAWLGIVPLLACRIFRCLFSGSFEQVLYLPTDLISTKNIPSDIFYGSFIVACTLFTFIGLVWLREQILNGGGPEWLDIDDQQHNMMHGNHPRNRHFDLPPGQNQVDDNDNHQEDDRGQDNGGGDDHNWNPVEWDRGEELTWERLLGLDGSLIFLEHVFWVISLNTLFIVAFAFLPYTFGYYCLLSLDLIQYAVDSRFEGFVCAFVGYVCVSIILLFTYCLVSFTRFNRMRKFLGLAYIVVKVSLLLTMEIGALPLVCGWWLDICSLIIFDTTVSTRMKNFFEYPVTSMFVHWLIGMVFVYYFASFVLLLREVLRPGVLWFLRNLNDPDFSPIQEMIQLPMMKHIRRLMISALIFGVTILLIIWIPAKILKFVWPSFLPYAIMSHSESLNELSLELFILQVVMPAVLEQSLIRKVMWAFLRTWCRAVSWLLDLHSYLLGNQDSNAVRQQEENARAAAVENNAGADAGLGAAHQALLQRAGPTGFEPYDRPTYFGMRIAVLFVLICATVVALSLVVLTVPVYVGRTIMGLYPMQENADEDNGGNDGRSFRVHELYTVCIGTYVFWLIARCTTAVNTWMPNNRAELWTRLRNSIKVFLKSTIATFWLVFVIPLLIGVLAELIFILPLRVPLNQTPVLWSLQDWALGVLCTKIACACILMGPEWRIRTAVDRLVHNGFRNLNLMGLMKEVVVPVVTVLSLILAVPYVIAYSIVPLFVRNFYIRTLVARRIYPFLWLSFLSSFVVILHIKQFMRLYEHIKNDKYLVGRRLVNYNHRR